jgi:hypothetical protein
MTEQLLALRKLFLHEPLLLNSLLCLWKKYDMTAKEIRKMRRHDL